jgi:hypothetical protein
MRCREPALLSENLPRHRARYNRSNTRVAGRGSVTAEPIAAEPIAARFGRRLRLTTALPASTASFATAAPPAEAAERVVTRLAPPYFRPIRGSAAAFWGIPVTASYLPPLAPYPTTRLRRGRRDPWSRLVAGRLTAGDLIWPVFVHDEAGRARPHRCPTPTGCRSRRWSTPPARPPSSASHDRGVSGDRAD